jgi:16S rRNA (guanine966-N2)-methyltransferase
VEHDREAARALEDNIARLGLTDRARFLRQDVARALVALEREGERFAVVFLDPPYAAPDGVSALEAIARGACLFPAAVVVAQHPTKAPLPATPGLLTHWKDRRFGETTLTFFRGGA